MKFRSIFASLLVALAVTVSVTSCSSDDDTPENKPTNKNSRLAYLLCNGKMDANNGSLTRLFFGESSIITTANFYEQQNKKKAGDLAQDLIYADGTLYMTVANSKSLVKMNSEGVELARYEFPASDGDPRYMAYYGGKLYVTVWGTGVVVFDAATMARETEIAVGPLPEHIQVWNGKIYVANQSNKFANPSIFDNRVSVINPLTKTKEQDITVVQNPTNLVLCAGRLYVASQGDFGDVAPSVQRLDLNGGNYSLTEVSTASTVWTDDSKLYMVQVTWGETSFTNEFSVYDPIKEKTTTGYFLNGTPAGVDEASFYMFYYDKKSDRYFIGTMRDFTSNGDVYVFDSDFNMLEQFDAGGMYPAKIVVVDL